MKRPYKQREAMLPAIQCMLRLLAGASLVFFEPPFLSQTSQTERKVMSCRRWFMGLRAANVPTNLEQAFDPSLVNDGGDL